MTEYEYYSNFQKLPNTNTYMNTNTNTNTNTKRNTNTNLGHIWNQTVETSLINVPSVIMPPLIQPV